MKVESWVFVIAYGPDSEKSEDRKRFVDEIYERVCLSFCRDEWVVGSIKKWRVYIKIII